MELSGPSARLRQAPGLRNPRLEPQVWREKAALTANASRLTARGSARQSGMGGHFHLGGGQLDG